jgi:hypothetical protein
MIRLDARASSLQFLSSVSGELLLPIYDDASRIRCSSKSPSEYSRKVNGDSNSTAVSNHS